MGRVTGWSSTWDCIKTIEDGFRYSDNELDQSSECDRVYVIEDVQFFMQDCASFSGSPKEFITYARLWLNELEDRKQAGRPIKTDTSMWDAWLLKKAENPKLSKARFIAEYDRIAAKCRIRRDQLIRRGRSQLDREGRARK